LRIFIVHAHHEPKSFNGALTHAAEQTLRSAGHEVIVSDLYAMNFNPVSDRRNFTTVKDPAYLKQQAEESHASAASGFAGDIQEQMDRLFWCDALIMQFPLWWFGLPAILKGWVDRVFAAGRIYGGGKWYDNGAFVGKRAMLSVTIGGPASMYEPDGLNGDIHKQILFPINHGILAFTGFTVVEPFLVHGPARLTHEERTAHIERYRQRVLDIMSAPTIAFPKLADYDDKYRLKPR
jgi:NAD(P)H dehydrogenase (quinone)